MDMARWEPDARGRLLQAAIELFGARGYDTTTAAQIAEHAGLTRTTLFRHFADKREILFQGQEALVVSAMEGVESAPADSQPFDALRAAVAALCTIHTADRRDTGRRLDTILASSPELQERAVFKRSAITNALHGALTARFGDARQAAVLADVGVRAYYDGFASWITSSDEGPLAEVVEHELDEYGSVLSRMTVG
ncbi:TetR/AcrR family transcriptional regulator [Curtobacterium sp. MCPF17_001]|nr:TetR/AcrR family transcriptional regulator [Curtobacterium sp. MCPF17_001]